MLSTFRLRKEPLSTDNDRNTSHAAKFNPKSMDIADLLPSTLALLCIGTIVDVLCLPCSRESTIFLWGFCFGGDAGATRARQKESLLSNIILFKYTYM
jgi:hypothetical protein